MLIMPYVLIGAAIGLLVVYVLGALWAYRIASKATSIINGKQQPPEYYIPASLFVALFWPIPILFVTIVLLIDWLSAARAGGTRFGEPAKGHSHADVQRGIATRKAHSLGFYETNFSPRRWHELLTDIRYGFEADYLERKYR